MRVWISPLGSFGAPDIRRTSGDAWRARLQTERGEKALQVLATKTRVNPTELRKQLESGTDVGRILKDHGVSRDDYQTALQAASLPPPPSGARRSQRPDAVPSRGGDSDGDNDGGGDGGKDSLKSAVMQAISAALGMSQSDLQSQLGSGMSLATVAQDKGVATDALLQSVMQSTQQGYAANGTPSSGTQPPGLLLDAAA